MGGVMVFSPKPRAFGSSSIELVEMRRRTERTDVMEMSND